ncbi:hypothetical protein BU26DRAFT_558922 [Trematosphaeria pertusa]|uniref:Uncharacterized protein n=1 Tax=Trematosphaeria pertusa TaxID=390896 RepID=A0A6A6IUV9_9PLEO|nr:uncharacterized protein BU26DRAFT_558922 [Trematosphaeria pertusa]KAF2254209.1 hypothetical protein BU26DRAFT_558922 [Trematosphaeria pertusa]
MAADATAIESEQAEVMLGHDRKGECDGSAKKPGFGKHPRVIVGAAALHAARAFKGLDRLVLARDHRRKRTLNNVGCFGRKKGEEQEQQPDHYAEEVFKQHSGIDAASKTVMFGLAGQARYTPTKKSRSPLLCEMLGRASTKDVLHAAY